jgi:hypothetical protein
MSVSCPTGRLLGLIDGPEPYASGISKGPVGPIPDPVSPAEVSPRLIKI